ncbi:MAG: sulfite exporter TauE/SafE family protein [Bacteroidales bacterium]|nr:sulfite exporter TauE/SafE family protein [Bacteroidales bacterium]MBQ2493577.1 sulfite exporter TauE/SafE family protein [Bacteroidales bacterium]
MIEELHNFLSTTPVTDYRMIILLICCGAFVGFINTIAGMATALSYGLFMMMGLPINVANGTTRVGVLLQFLTTSAIFKKEGYLDMKTGWRVGIPVGCGAIFGALLAAVLKVKVIEIVMAILLPIMSVLLFIDKKKISRSAGKLKSSDANSCPGEVLSSFWIFIIFMAIGVYGGFTHSGVGLLIMFGSFFLLGLDMIRSNAIKQFAVVIYTPLALTVFIIYGQVNWGIALIYAIGNIIGGIAGSYASIKAGEKFIKVFVAVIVITMSSYLILKHLI